MKKHKHLIRLIIVTAAIIGLGVYAFKYLQNRSVQVNCSDTVTTQCMR